MENLESPSNQTASEPVATAPSQPVVSPEAPQRSRLKLILLSLLGLILVGGVAYGVYTMGQKQMTPSFLPEQEEVTKPLPTPTPDETASWKTYKNEDYGFEFKYPNNWMYGEDNSFHNRNGINIYLRREELKSTSPTYGEINIWIFNSTKTLNEFIDSKMCNEIERCELSKDKDTEIVKLGGIDARKIKDKGGPVPSDQIITKNNNVIIELLFNYIGESRENYSNLESKKIFDQILSNFKFIDNSQSSETVNALSVYQEGQLSEEEKRLLVNVYWQKLKPYKEGDKTRQIYLVDCKVTNDDLGVRLTAVPEEIDNPPQIAYPENVTWKAIETMVKKSLGYFPSPEEIANYEKISGRNFVHKESGINGVLLKWETGLLTVNFYDSVAAYGGGSSKVGCMSEATNLTAKQFPFVKKVKACIEKYENCEMDFQP